MRKIIISCLFLLLSLTLLHSHHTINYQAIVTTENGEIIKESPVGVRFRILRDNVALYLEEATVQTTRNGLLNYKIGSNGNVDLLSIDWTDDGLQLEVAIDPRGGTDYNLTLSSDISASPLSLVSLSSIDGQENAMVIQRLNERFDSITFDFESYGLAIETVNGRIDSTNYVVNSNSDRLEAMKAVIDINSTCVDSLNLSVDNFKERIENLGINLDSILNRIDITETRIDSLSSRMNFADIRLDSVYSRLDSLGIKVDSLGLDFDTLGIKVDTLGMQVGSFAWKLDSISYSLDSLCRRVENLENRFKDLSDNLQKNIQDAVNDKIKAVDNLIVPNPFTFAPQYYHFEPIGFIKNAAGENVIPSQSIADIELAARLGFKFIEANIQITADGKYICTHGNAGKFGPMFTSDVKDMLISETTLDYIKENVFYAGDYEKYNTPPPTLEEFCEACRINNIGIFAGIPDEESIRICLDYLGENNVIIYNPPNDIRKYFNGYVFQWWNSETPIETLVGWGEHFGAPYMCGLGEIALRYHKENNTLRALVSEMHRKQLLIGVTGVYDTEENIRYAMSQGMDFNCSGHELNPFEANFEIYDIDLGIDDFNTYGNWNNGVLNLLPGQTLICGSQKPIALGKGQLNIQFEGKLKIEFGSLGISDQREVESDGSNLIIISDYFFQRPTTLKITAIDDCKITHLVYKTAKS